MIIIQIFELMYPGTWLQMGDTNLEHEIQNLLSIIQSEFTEAALALSLFQSTRNIKPPRAEDWGQDSERRQQLRRKYEEQYGFQVSMEKYQEISSLIDIEFKREKWMSGELPTEYKHKIPFIHAKSFLSNLATIGRLFDVVSKTANVPEAVNNITENFYSHFSELREVRNSFQHIEDRGRGLGRGRNPKPMVLKAVDNNIVKADGGALILNSLNGEKFGSTMADGAYGEVEVSIDSLEIVQKCIQELLDCFEWQGPKRHYPS